MVIPKTGPMASSFRPVVAAIKTVPIPDKQPYSGAQPRRAEPFITISRQAGAGGWTLAQKLVERLNRLQGTDPWTCWDKELIERIAMDSKIAEPLIASLEETSRSWLQDLFAGLCFTDGGYASELAVFRHVASAIRALAQAGRVVIVGRCGVYITRGMPAGIHIRLVAPFEHRVAFMQGQWSVSHDAAAARIREMDRNRDAFYKRYFPKEVLSAETFTMQLNTHEIDEDRLIACVLPLVTGLPYSG